MMTVSAKTPATVRDRPAYSWAHGARLCLVLLSWVQPGWRLSPAFTLPPGVGRASQRQRCGLWGSAGHGGRQAQTEALSPQLPPGEVRPWVNVSHIMRQGLRAKCRGFLRAPLSRPRGREDSPEEDGTQS